MRNINLEIANTTSNYSRTEFFKNWFTKRGYKIVEYQQDILSNKLTFNCEPTVLAVSPGGGKTLMSIAAIDKYCLDNPTHRVLVLTHGQTVLRSQYSDDIFNAKPNFTWTTIVSKLDPNSPIPQIESKDFEVSNVQVIVSLPQSIRTKTLTHFDLVVVDEAHQFYFAEMVQSILKNVSPQHELLLTGSPSPFIRSKFKNIIPVSLEVLADSGRICNPIIEVAGSTYDFKQSDYNADYELKSEINIKTEDTKSTLTMVLKEMCNKLGIESNWDSALKKLSKTMVVCRGKEQAKDAYAFFKNENINAALSLSENDKDSSEIKRFKEKDDCLILIVIRRGILGFNFIALTNVIDLSCSQNIDKILQLLCRVVRKSPTNEQKFFYKVCPIDLVDHFKYVMTAVLCLTNQEYFMKFNGKDFLDLPLPAMSVKDSVKDIKVNDNECSYLRNKKTQFKPLEFSGLPAFNFFKNCISDIKNNTLSSYALTTLSDVSRKMISRKNASMDDVLDNCIDTYVENGCKKISDYLKVDMSGYNWLYRNGFLAEFHKRLGVKAKPKAKANQLENLNPTQRFEYYCNFFIDNKYKTLKEYSIADKSGYHWLRNIGLMLKFQERVICNGKFERNQFLYLNSQQRLESCIKVFRENYCKSSGDYRKIDPTGYHWMTKKGILEDFYKIIKFENQGSRFFHLNKEEGLELCYKFFIDNNCKTKKDYTMADQSGYRWLKRNDLLATFYQRVNISVGRWNT